METGEIYLDQSHYIDSIEEPSIHSFKNNINPLSDSEYSIFRALVGSLNWLVCGSRPDLAFDVLEHSSKFKTPLRVGDPPAEGLKRMVPAGFIRVP